jgi:hypothetical protein
LVSNANKVLQGFDEELEEEVESIIARRYWHRYTLVEHNNINLQCKKNTQIDNNIKFPMQKTHTNT